MARSVVKEHRSTLGLMLEKGEGERRKEKEKERRRKPSTRS
jgi:hypothetical protein